MLNQGTSRTSMEVRRPAPSLRLIRCIAPVGLPQAGAAWRNRGMGGWTISLSPAVTALAHPRVPRGEVRQEPLWSSVNFVVRRRGQNV
jgi:hypothetical protein